MSYWHPGNLFCNICLFVLIRKYTRWQILFCNRIVKESQRVGRSKVIWKCISIGKIEWERTFLAHFCETLIVRGTISDYNKESQIFCWRRGCWVSNAMLCGWLYITIYVLADYANLWDRSNYELFLSREWFHLLVLNLVQQMNNECFNKQWAISMLIFLLCSIYSKLYQLSVKFCV